LEDKTLSSEKPFTKECDQCNNRKKQKKSRLNISPRCGNTEFASNIYSYVQAQPWCSK